MKHAYRLFVLLVVGITVLATLTACGGTSADPAGNPPAAQFTDTPQGLNIADAGIPSFDELDTLAVQRQVSGTFHVDGDQAVDWSAGETPADPFIMISDPGGYRYATYAFSPVHLLAKPEKLVLNLAGSSGTVWVGISDYDRGAWTWLQKDEPHTTWDEIDITALPDHQYWRTDGFMYVCLLVHDGAQLNFAGANLDTASHPLVDPIHWQFHVIGTATGPNYGTHHAALISPDGKPMVVFTRDDSDDIYFAYSSVESPEEPAAWTMYAVDTGDDRGGHVTIAYGAGPAIAYEDVNRQDVYFAYSNAMEPTDPGNWTSYQPDTDAISQPQLGYGDSRFWLAYIRIGGGLYYTYSDAVPYPTMDLEWEAPDFIDTGANYDYLSMAMHPDGPMLAYQRKEGGPQKLYLAWWNHIADPGAVDEFTTVLVDDTNTNNGNFAKLVIDSNFRPWIGYTNVDIVHYMRFAHGVVETPETQGMFNRYTVFGQLQTHTGQWLGMADVNGGPFFSFIETGSGSVGGMHGIYANREVDALVDNDAFDHELLYTPGPSELVNQETEVIVLSSGAPAAIFRTNEGLMFGMPTGL